MFEITNMRFLLISVGFVSCLVTVILTMNIPADQPLPKQKGENTEAEAFVNSMDKKPNLILTHAIKSDKKKFIGLLLIPCEC